MPSPAYGEIWFGDLDPTVGHEQAGKRPVLVVSPDVFNQSRLRLVFVVPLTSNLHALPSRVSVSPPEGGLTRPCMILCEAMRSVSQDRLARRLGAVSPQTMLDVQDRLRILLDL
jgi:mRNA interferase MazF